MYIKIKNIKKGLLISACIFFAGVNYFNYVKADALKENCNKTIDFDCDALTNDEEVVYGTDLHNKDTDGDGYSDGVEIESGYDPLKPSPDDKISLASTTTSEAILNSADNSLMTDEFIQRLDTLAQSKSGSAVSKEDVEGLLNDTLTETVKGVSWDSLPQVDTSELKILKQPYSQIKTEESKKQLQQDASIYIVKITYLLLSNAPVSIVTDDEAKEFAEEFLSKLTSFAMMTPDFEYFAEIGKRFGLVSDQAKEIEVPETMLDLHVKFIRWSKGISTLNEAMPKNTNDPIANMVAISQISNYMKLAKEFAENDLQDYINSIK